MSWIDELEAEVTKNLDAIKRYATPLDLAIGLDPMYRARPHLKYLSDRLAAAVKKVEEGENQFIMVSMPPRLGKSHLASNNFPVWVLNQHPGWKIMLLSHDPTLASGWGRQVRRAVEDNPALGLKIAGDAGAVTDWETTKGGKVLSRSVRQSITGQGAKVMIVDDAVKDFAEAHSKTAREFVWDWWLATASTRLEPPFLVVFIGTRWHEDDLLGRALNPETAEDFDKWEIIRFPAIAEGEDVLGRTEGEPLISPLVDETEAEALTRWAGIRKSVGEYAWAALYQQRPAPADGAIFNNDWWQYYEPNEITEESCNRVITSWDFTFKATDGSDYVVGTKWGVIGANRYLLDLIRGRWTFTETLEVMRRFCEGVHEHVVEEKANGAAIIDTLRSEISGLIPINPKESKEARARAVTPEIESENVWLPKGAPWLGEFLAEARSFPSGAHDDQIDSVTQALMRLRSAGEVTPLLPRATMNRGFGQQVGRRRV